MLRPLAFPRRSVHLLACCLVVLAASACSTGRGTGTLAGGGVGGLLGGIFGGWQGAAIGSAVGAGTGYIIGNEIDQKKARDMEKVPAAELMPFMGTRWVLTELTSKEGIQFQSVDVEFRRDGIVEVKKVEKGGLTTITQERYRVVGGILIVNKPGYVANVEYTLSGNTLYLHDKVAERKATLTRIG